MLCSDTLAQFYTDMKQAKDVKTERRARNALGSNFGYDSLSESGPLVLFFHGTGPRLGKWE